MPRVRLKGEGSLQREQLFAMVHGCPSLLNFVNAVDLQGLLITGARREELADLGHVQAESRGFA